MIRCMSIHVHVQQKVTKYYIKLLYQLSYTYQLFNFKYKSLCYNMGFVFSLELSARRYFAQAIAFSNKLIFRNLDTIFSKVSDFDQILFVLIWSSSIYIYILWRCIKAIHEVFRIVAKISLLYTYSQL